MRKWLLFGNLCVCLLLTSASAWWDEGHMQIAAVAYERLTPAVRAKVDLLIKLNPEYANWVGSYPPRKAAQYAFVRAAVWADDIKTPAMGHTEKGDKPTSPNAATVTLRLHVEALGAVTKLVHSGVAHIGVCRPLHVSVPGLERIKVGGVELIPVAAPNHLLAIGSANADPIVRDF